MFIEEWLGKENQLGIDIWKKKYQRNGESFEDWLERVSGGDADVAELIADKKFLLTPLSARTCRGCSSITALRSTACSARPI